MSTFIQLMCSGKHAAPTSSRNTSSIAVAHKATQTALPSPGVFLSSPHSPAAVPSPKKRKIQPNKNKTSFYVPLQQEEIKTTQSGNNAGDCHADLRLSGLKYRSLPVIWKDERRQWSQTSSPTPRPFLHNSQAWSTTNKCPHYVSLWRGIQLFCSFCRCLIG